MVVYDQMFVQVSALFVGAFWCLCCQMIADQTGQLSQDDAVRPACRRHRLRPTNCQRFPLGASQARNSAVSIIAGTLLAGSDVPHPLTRLP